MDPNIQQKMYLVLYGYGGMYRAHTRPPPPPPPPCRPLATALDKFLGTAPVIPPPAPSSPCKKRKKKEPIEVKEGPMDRFLKKDKKKGAPWQNWGSVGGGGGGHGDVGGAAH